MPLRALWTLAGGAAVLLAAAALWLRWSSASWLLMDLRVYVDAAHAVVQGSDPYLISVPVPYGPALHFTYPPFAALVFVPLDELGGAAAVALTAASLGALILVIIVVARRLAMPLVPVVLIATPVALCLEPVQRTLLYGQVNLILLALVVVDLLVLDRGRRGLLVGLAAGLKVTPAVFVLYLLLRRDLPAAVRALGVLLSTMVVGWVVMPSTSTNFWLHDFGSTQRFGPEIRLWGNQSLKATLDRASQPHAPHLLMTVVLSTLIALAVVMTGLVASREWRRGESVAALCCVAVGGLLVSPVSWTHHYVWVVPIALLAVKRGWWLFATLTIGIFFVPPMWALAARPDGAVGYSPAELLVSVAWVLWDIVFLLRCAASASTSMGTPVQARQDLGGPTPLGSAGPPPARV